MNTGSRGVVAILAAFPCPAAADAAPSTLDPVVVIGSRVEHGSFDLPGAVDIVDAGRIGADNARVNVSEALAAVPGVTVQNRQHYAQDLQISSRDFGAGAAFGVSGIRLISDGVPASMPDGQGQAATFNLDRAKRMEVMRGPMSAIYGNHSGGVIDFNRDFSGLGTRWIGRYELGGGRLTATVGLDYEKARDDRRGYENFVGQTLGVKGALRRDEVNSATSFDRYVQAEWLIGQWNLTGGLRHSSGDYKVTDHYVTDGNQDTAAPSVTATRRLCWRRSTA